MVLDIATSNSYEFPTTRALGRISSPTSTPRTHRPAKTYRVPRWTTRSSPTAWQHSALRSRRPLVANGNNDGPSPSAASATPASTPRPRSRAGCACTAGSGEVMRRSSLSYAQVMCHDPLHFVSSSNLSGTVAIPHSQLLFFPHRIWVTFWIITTTTLRTLRAEPVSFQPELSLGPSRTTLPQVRPLIVTICSSSPGPTPHSVPSHSCFRGDQAATCVNSISTAAS